MSKQTLGDGLFWEKDDYFNLEDEETRGAARSGRNPNAPAWDPEEMELLRMVDRLLEERRYLPVATKASGAACAPQREAAAVLGEGRGRLVQARGGRPGGQQPERSTGDIFFFFTFCMKQCKKPVKRWPINALDGHKTTSWPLNHKMTTN